MLHYPFIKVSGATYYEIGKDYGRQAKDLIAPRHQRLQAGICGQLRPFLGGDSAVRIILCGHYAEGAPEVMEEVEASPRVQAFPWRTSWWSTAAMKSPNSPRSMSAPRPRCCLRRARDGKMYLVKNWDYRVGIMDHVMIIHITQPDGTRIMGLTEAGQVIRGGMNSHGLGSVSNNLQSIYDAWAVGLPTVFARRQLLKYKTFDEIKDFILNFPRAVSCIS